ncbi:MAG: hypothetical protein J7L21_07475 [Sulfurimonas sp.]|nr:hypothetical protein [Sulfurimonas sp.]
MTQKQLSKKLEKEFKDTKIVKLKDITKKIAIVSKVRVTKRRECTNYDEISLNHIDDYGVVYIPDGFVNQGPASLTAINAQALHYGDLVLNQRTAKMKVGFIGKNYKKVIVGNNSMIRVQFYNDSIDTARFVQLYLQLPYVLEYLNEQAGSSIASGVFSKLQKLRFTNKNINLTLLDYQYHYSEFFRKPNRKILSSAQLGELPIPRYTDKEQLVSLSEVLYPKMQLIAQAKKMRDDAQKLIEKYEAKRLESIGVNFQKEFDFNTVDKEISDIDLFNKISKFYSPLLE